MAWGTPVEIETHRRIKVAVWAYAYEVHEISLVSDAEFDREAILIDLKIDTGSTRMDRWFRANFTPSTGMWVRQHPALQGLEKAFRLRALA